MSGNPSFIQLTGVEYYNALLKEQLAQFYDDLCGYSSMVWRHFMSHHDNELDKKELINGADDASDTPCPQRRRLLAILGVGVATAYIAPTLI